MDLISYQKFHLGASIVTDQAAPLPFPPPLGFEEDHRRVILHVKLLNGRHEFEGPPAVIPFRRFFTEGAAIAARMAVDSYGWSSEYIDHFVARCERNLSRMAADIAADPRSRSEDLTLSSHLTIIDGMFPRRFVEHHELEIVARRSEETAFAAAAARVFPADKGAVGKLPIVEITDGDEDLCCICLEELSINPWGLGMPCSHVFHRNCLLSWLDVNHVCPICRYALPVV